MSCIANWLPRCRKVLALGCAAVSTITINHPAGVAAVEQQGAVRIYKVDRKVADFGTNENLSTPEAAYASIHRACVAEGNAAWGRLTAPDLARRVPSAPKRPLPASEARRFLEAEILAAAVYWNTNAVVLASMEFAEGRRVDVRWLRLHTGRWLNAGNDVMPDLESAKQRMNATVAHLEARTRLDSRAPAADPQARLAPFVAFLEAEAKDPEVFLLEALSMHRLVVLGEVHHRPIYWELNARLIRRPEFARHTGVIYLELPSNGQPLLEEFLASPTYEPTLVIDILRDMLWMGWPDQPMLEFFKAVWDANRVLAADQQLRVVLVDMARPWKEIRRPSDWRKYEVDRDLCMAQNICQDLRQQPDARHGFFIVGYGHGMLNLTRPGGESIRSAGWHLRRELGDSNVFAIFPHGPVMSNEGQTGGRIALGLFEAAFAAISNRPVGFPLGRGPFGQEVFDASTDHLTTDKFRDGYSGYLYLGPLENESMSGLIPGFYTDEFAAELDRRSRALFGKGLVEAHGIRRVDGASMAAWMGTSWGRSRREWSLKALGPVNAWVFGSQWKQKQVEAILTELRSRTRPGTIAALTEAPDSDPSLKQRLVSQVEEFFQHNFRDLSSRKTIEWGEFGRISNGLIAIRYKYSAHVWGSESVIKDQLFVFDTEGSCVSVSDVP